MQKTLRRGFTLIEIMIVVMIIGILLAIAVPNFAKAREKSRVRGCVTNLTRIQSAKMQWAMETRQPQTATPNASDLYGPGKFILGDPAGPTCPANSSTYTINNVASNAECGYAVTDPLHTLP